MAIQRKIDLNQPVSSGGDTKLEPATLRPEFSEASLILHADYYRQMQSLFTKAVLWHPASVSAVVAAISGYSYYCVKDYIEVAETTADFIRMVRKSGDLAVMLLLNFVVVLAVVGFLGVCSFMISDEFRIISDNMIKPEYMQYVFGFELTKYSKLESDAKAIKEKKLLANGDNSQLILYKDEPIAVITLKVLPDQSNDANLLVKITGLSVRKAFKPLNFEQILIDWSLSRARVLLKSHLSERKIKDSRGCKVSLLIDNYSFNTEFARFLKANKFSKVASDFNYNPTKGKTALLNGLINKGFGSTRDTYGVHIVEK